MSGLTKRGGWGPAAPGPGQPIQLQVDLSKATQLSCACGCKHFTVVQTVYMVSALVSPTGQDLTAQVPVLLCLECKAVLQPGKKEAE